MRVDLYRQTTLKFLPVSFAGDNNMKKTKENEAVMSLAERIRLVMKEMPGPDRGKQSRLSRIADESKQTVNHWLTERVTEIQYDAAKRISEELGFRIEWLLRGKGPIRKDDKDEPEAVAEKMQLVYLTQQEMEIITNYRSSDELGRAIIFAASAQSKRS